MDPGSIFLFPPLKQDYGSFKKKNKGTHQRKGFRIFPHSGNFILVDVGFPDQASRIEKLIINNKPFSYIPNKTLTLTKGFANCKNVFRYPEEILEEKLKKKEELKKKIDGILPPPPTLKPLYTLLSLFEISCYYIYAESGLL